MAGEARQQMIRNLHAYVESVEEEMQIIKRMMEDGVMPEATGENLITKYVVEIEACNELAAMLQQDV